MKAKGLRVAVQCFVVAVGLTLIGCKSVPETTAAGPGARIVSVEGRARCSDASNSWRKLGAGNTVTTGNLIQTALTSATDIAVPVAGGSEADRILLEADAILFIEGLPTSLATGGGDSLKLHLRQGELKFTSPPSGLGSPSEIRFAKGSIAARGATFDLTAEGVLSVFRGVVTLKPSGDKLARNIEAGNRYDPQTGQLTPIPVGREANTVNSAPAQRLTPPSATPWPTRKY